MQSFGNGRILARQNCLRQFCAPGSNPFHEIRESRGIHSAVQTSLDSAILCIASPTKWRLSCRGGRQFTGLSLFPPVRIPLTLIYEKDTASGVLFIYGGSRGIRTPVGLHPNGFQDRLVMTASICFRIKLSLYIMPVKAFFVKWFT